MINDGQHYLQTCQGLCSHVVVQQELLVFVVIFQHFLIPAIFCMYTLCVCACVCVCVCVVCACTCILYGTKSHILYNNVDLLHIFF